MKFIVNIFNHLFHPQHWKSPSAIEGHAQCYFLNYFSFHYIPLTVGIPTKTEEELIKCHGKCSMQEIHIAPVYEQQLTINATTSP